MAAEEAAQAGETGTRAGSGSPTVEDDVAAVLDEDVLEVAARQDADFAAGVSSR